MEGLKIFTALLGVSQSDPDNWSWLAPSLLYGLLILLLGVSAALQS